MIPDAPEPEGGGVAGAGGWDRGRVEAVMNRTLCAVMSELRRGYAISGSLPVASNLLTPPFAFTAGIDPGESCTSHPTVGTRRTRPQKVGLSDAGLLVVCLSPACRRRDSKRLPVAGNVSIPGLRPERPKIFGSLAFPRFRGPYNVLDRLGGVCTAGAGPGLQNL